MPNQHGTAAIHHLLKVTKHASAHRTNFPRRRETPIYCAVPCQFPPEPYSLSLQSKLEHTRARYIVRPLVHTNVKQTPRIEQDPTFCTQISDNGSVCRTAFQMESSKRGCLIRSHHSPFLKPNTVNIQPKQAKNRKHQTSLQWALHAGQPTWVWTPRSRFPDPGSQSAPPTC